MGSDAAAAQARLTMRRPAEDMGSQDGHENGATDRREAADGNGAVHSDRGAAAGDDNTPQAADGRVTIFSNKSAGANGMHENNGLQEQPSPGESSEGNGIVLDNDAHKADSQRDREATAREEKLGSEMESAKARADAAEEQLAQLKSELTSAKEDLTTESESRSKLQSKVQSLEEECRCLTENLSKAQGAADAQVQTAQKDLQTAEKRIVELTEKVAAINKDLSNMVSRVSALETQEQHMLAEVAKLAKVGAAKSEEAAEATRQVAQLRATNEGLEKQLAAVKGAGSDKPEAWSHMLITVSAAVSVVALTVYILSKKS
eukprot:SM000016S01934  [mRNA]  locus=s16:715829:717499:+ [translate_table: standard]